MAGSGIDDSAATAVVDGSCGIPGAGVAAVPLLHEVINKIKKSKRFVFRDTNLFINYGRFSRAKYFIRID